MNTWRSLLWKEWREQRAVGLAILAVLVLVPLLAAFSDLRDIHLGISMAIVFATPLFAVFIGMGIASGEHSRQTIHFLQALPTSTRQSAMVKLVVGAATLVTPIILAVLLYASLDWLIAELSEETSDFFKSLTESSFPKYWGVGNFYASTALAGSILSTSLMIWTVAAGANRKDEISAGAMAVAVIAVVYAGVLFLVCFVDRIALSSHFIAPLLACFPGAAAMIQKTKYFANVGWFERYVPYLFFAILSHGILVGIFLKRYGKALQENRELSLPFKKSKQSDWLALPRRSTNTSLAWKTWRELAPLLAVGVIITAVITLLLYVETNRVDWRQQFYAIWMLVGGFVSVALGIGLFREDLAPGLHTFWRSRPASIGQWF